MIGNKQSFTYQKNKTENGMEIDYREEIKESSDKENRFSDNSYYTDEDSSGTEFSEHSENNINNNSITKKSNKQSILKKSAANAGFNLSKNDKIKSKGKSIKTTDGNISYKSLI